MHKCSTGNIANKAITKDSASAGTPAWADRTLTQLYAYSIENARLPCRFCAAACWLLRLRAKPANYLSLPALHWPAGAQSGHHCVVQGTKGHLTAQHVQLYSSCCYQQLVAAMPFLLSSGTRQVPCARCSSGIWPLEHSSGIFCSQFVHHTQ